jgi:hypothetical protein
MTEKKKMTLYMTLSRRNENASYSENFQCDSSKINDDDDERSETIGKKHSTDVEDE